MVNGRLMLVVAVLCGLASGFTSSANASVDEKTSAFVLCKNQKDVRSIRISPEQNGTCGVTYSKGGTEQSLGKSRSLGGCKSILQNVQNNLQDSKFRCRTVGSAVVTTSSEVSAQ